MSEELRREFGGYLHSSEGLIMSVVCVCERERQREETVWVLLHL